MRRMHGSYSAAKCSIDCEISAGGEVVLTWLDRADRETLGVL